MFAMQALGLVGVGAETAVEVLVAVEPVAVAAGSALMQGWSW